MTQTKPPTSGFFASIDWRRGQIVSFVFGAILIVASVMVLIVADHYAIGEPFTPPSQLDRKVLFVTYYESVFFELAAFLFIVGAVFLMSQRPLTLPILALIVACMAATVLLGVLFLDRFRAIMVAPLILVFMLIAPDDPLIRVIAIVGAALLGGVTILISILYATFGNSVDTFNYEGREYYLVADYREEISGSKLVAYTCDGTTCVLLYPCEMDTDTACIDEADIIEAWINR